LGRSKWAANGPRAPPRYGCRCCFLPVDRHAVYATLAPPLDRVVDRGHVVEAELDREWNRGNNGEEAGRKKGLLVPKSRRKTRNMRG
jgi:hypothetical protein